MTTQETSGHQWCTETTLPTLYACIVRGGVQTRSTRHVGHLLAYCTWPGWLWGWRIWWNEWQGKPKYSEKTCRDTALSTTNPTWPDPGLNPGRRGGKPATNRFSYGAANIICLLGVTWRKEFTLSLGSEKRVCIYDTGLELHSGYNSEDCLEQRVPKHERYASILSL
jgi:hypothetical protein